MRSFYTSSDFVEPASLPAPSTTTKSEDLFYIGTRARVAVYDGPAAAPYVEDIEETTAPGFIERLASRVYELAKGAGGSIPYTVVREVTENLIHAEFCEPVISVLDAGETIRFSDQGPGFSDAERALEPGFTTATSSMKTVIRGVGSGLPIVREFLALSGGRLVIEENLRRGAVVTLYADRCPSPATSDEPSPGEFSPLTRTAPQPTESLFSTPAVSAGLQLTNRQKQVLALVLESGSAGPSLVSRELGVGLSTAYRDLAFLEELGLICSDGGKRTLTDRGSTYLSAALASDY